MRLHQGVAAPRAARGADCSERSRTYVRQSDVAAQVPRERRNRGGSRGLAGVGLAKVADARRRRHWPLPGRIRRPRPTSPIPRRSRVAPSRSTWASPAPARVLRKPPGGRSSSSCPEPRTQHDVGHAAAATSSASAPAASPAGAPSAARSTPRRVINMVVADGAHRTTLTNGIFQYYAETALPTNGAWKSDQKALGLGTAWTPTHAPARERPVVDGQLAAVPLLARPVDDDDRRRQRRHRCRRTAAARPASTSLAS